MSKRRSIPSKAPSRQSGFTIIELLIATIVFSLVLIVLLEAFIRTSNLFYKGVTMNSTQEDTRTITESIENDIKFTQTPPADLTATATRNSTGQFCIGNHRYSYQVGHQLGAGAPGDYALSRDTISVGTGCPSTATLAATNQVDEMLDPGMQLNNLKINCSSGSRCTVNVHVVFYGGSPSAADELFYSPSNPTASATATAPDAECTGSLSSNQICATADFNRTVLINS